MLVVSCLIYSNKKQDNTKQQKLVLQKKQLSGLAISLFVDSALLRLSSAPLQGKGTLRDGVRKVFQVGNIGTSNLLLANAPIHFPLNSTKSVECGWVNFNYLLIGQNLLHDAKGTKVVLPR